MKSFTRIISCLLALVLLGGLFSGAALADGEAAVQDVFDFAAVRAAVEAYSADGAASAAMEDALVADVSDAPVTDGVTGELPWCQLDPSAYDQTCVYGDEASFTLRTGYGAYSSRTADFWVIVYEGTIAEGADVAYFTDAIDSSYSTHTLTLDTYEFDADTYYIVVCTRYYNSAAGDWDFNNDSFDFCVLTVVPRDIAGAAVTVTPSTVTAGSTPTVTVVVDGKTLAQGADYTVRYTEVVGANTVTVTGKGNYTGTSTASFTVVDPVALPFEDVPSNASYYTALQWAYGNGIVKGTSATTFSPNDDCTRGQFALMLYRLAGKPDVTGLTNPFTDVKTSSAYYKAILWAYNEGIIKGTSATTFNPYGSVTRGQIVLMLYRMAGKPTVTNTTNPFSDVQKSDSCYKAVLWAVEKGITKGTSATTFSPNNHCTRYQLVLFLYRFNRLMNYI